MSTRFLSLFLPAFLVLLLCSCASVPVNDLPLYQRSMVIMDETTADETLAKASMETITEPGVMPLRVLYLKGSPYEMGFQHGALLRDEVQAMYASILGKVKLMVSEDMMDEVYDLMAPYIPVEEQEEMRGLAHGAGVPLRVVHWFHSIPEVSEYGGKKRFSKGFKGISCSNVAAFGSATADGELYHLRVLDWMRKLGVQQRPAILVHQPKEGFASTTFGYAGFIGAVSGMNSQRMTFGEMGYGNPPGETMEGIPFVFLFRRLMREAASLEDVSRILKEVPRTNSYVYVVADAKAPAGDKSALLYITDRNRVLSFAENTLLKDEREKGDTYLPIDDLVYGGARGDVLYEQLNKHHGNLSPETLMELTKTVALKSNLMNVIMKPATFEIWINNASLDTGPEGVASLQPWLHLDLSRALKKGATPQR